MNHVEFENQLKAISWDDVLCLNDATEAYNVWYTKFIALLDSFAPIKKKRVRQKKFPWMSINILDSMRINVTDLNELLRNQSLTVTGSNIKNIKMQ